jgi:outer membrane protein assembly factor BamB
MAMDRLGGAATVRIWEVIYTFMFKVTTRSLTLLIIAVACGLIIHAQNRERNWPTYGGDAQRSGSFGTDFRITKDTVKEFQLLWKMKLESQSRGLRPVLPPVILGRLISYRGFRELAFVATNSDIVYAIDADLGKIFWQKHLEYSVAEPQSSASSWGCPGGLTAMPLMPVPTASAAAAPPVPPVAGAAGDRGPANAFIGGPTSVYAISSDGRLHRVNTSTGDDITQPVSVLPANAHVAGLNMADSVIYAVTSHSCNGAQDAVWAIDLNGEAPKAASFELTGGGVWGLGGAVIGKDGTAYVQTGDGLLLSLSPRELALQHSVMLPAESKPNKAARDIDMNAPSPVVFPYKSHELIVTAAHDGRLSLLDAASFELLYRTPPVADSENLVDRGVWGNLSSWEDTDGTRWVLAPVWGPLHLDLKPSISNGSAPNGSVVAFKVEDQAGKPSLTPLWVSRDLNSPMPPVIASGIVFALSTGEFVRQIKESGIDERPKGSAHATLYALDGRTGRELYSSRNLVTTPASLTGMTTANGRVYFGGIDGTVYAFGMYMEH